MTIQTMIINKSSLILASDLAVTMDEYKSYVGIKKVFELNSDFPIGFMINGLMDFEKIPLETLIGEFKNEIKYFDSIEKIKNNFINFLSKNTNSTSIDDYLNEILETFKQNLIDLLLEEDFDNVINNKQKKSIPEFVKNYSNFDNEFLELIPNEYEKEEYNLKIWEIFAFELSFEGTGIIIAGFDKSHHYPSFFVFNIYFNNNGNIVFEDVESRINCEEPLIRVYAINEEAYSFITGVSNDFENSIKKYIFDSNKDIIQYMDWYLENENIDEKEKIMSVLKNELNGTYNDLNKYIDFFKLDILNYTSNSCEYLPRKILCNLADSLIKLTALKQKLSIDLETVSSENDIALITKVNNLKWVKYTNEII